MENRATGGRRVLLAAFTFIAFLKADPLSAGPVLELRDTVEWASASLWSPSPPPVAALGFVPAHVGDVLGPSAVANIHGFAPSLAVDVLQASTLVEQASSSSDLVHRRAIDWDVPPTTFDEFVVRGDAGSDAPSKDLIFSRTRDDVRSMTSSRRPGSRRALGGGGGGGSGGSAAGGGLTGRKSVEGDHDRDKTLAEGETADGEPAEDVVQELPLLDSPEFVREGSPSVRSFSDPRSGSFSAPASLSRTVTPSSVDAAESWTFPDPTTRLLDPVTQALSDPLLDALSDWLPQAPSGPAASTNSADEQQPAGSNDSTAPSPDVGGVQPPVAAPWAEGGTEDHANLDPRQLAVATLDGTPPYTAGPGDHALPDFVVDRSQTPLNNEPTTAQAVPEAPMLVLLALGGAALFRRRGSPKYFS